MDPNNISPLADGTILLAENLNVFKEIFNCLLDYLKGLYQIPNIQKTIYYHFSPTPSTDSIQINKNTCMSGVNESRGHRYPSMKLIPTNKFDEIIKFNLND